MNKQTLIIISFSIIALITIRVVSYSYSSPGVSHIRYLFNRLKFIGKKPGINPEIKTCERCKRFFYSKKHEGDFCGTKCFDEFQEETRQIFKYNNRCKHHPLERKTYRNECWRCYKKNWSKNLKKNKEHLSFTAWILCKFYGFSKTPTFRTSTESWAGDRVAFEQSLLDMKIGYFVYIKLYKRGNSLTPIVCGMSGSNKVNGGGSDVEFSMDTREGKSKRFLDKNKMSWCYDIILIKASKNRKKAYEYESIILNKFKLYGS